MREITEEQIISIIEKHRDFFLADVEDNLCLMHYNLIHKQNLTEIDVILEKSKCFFCGEEKLCVKTNQTI